MYGTRTKRPGDAAWRNLAVKISYRVIAWCSDVPIPIDTGDFRLISRRVRDALEACGEYNRYMRGMIAWLGFRQTGIPYERRPRLGGESKLGFSALVAFAFNAITSFSLKPLRMFTVFGFIVMTAAILAVGVYAILTVLGHPPAGIPTLIVLAWIGIGLQSLGIGILGEYVGKSYAEVKRRPLYLIEETGNLESARTAPEP